MQSEKLEYDNKINYGKLMPRRAENFGMPTDYRRNPRTSVWFPSVVACYLFWKMPIFLIPLGFGFFFAKRNKVQTHPPTLPSPLRILIVPVTAAKRNKRSMTGTQNHKIPPESGIIISSPEIIIYCFTLQKSNFLEIVSDASTITVQSIKHKLNSWTAADFALDHSFLPL